MNNEVLLGFDDVQGRFASSIQEQRLHHAWLFYGAKGIGKAKLAKALAALYLCESPNLAQAVACGQCHACTILHASSHPDFLQMELLFDAKKKKWNRDINIEQTRDALDFLALSGLKSQKRVLLIDGADLMNHQAANALLKGLEEPTAGSLLLIVCHDLLRLPATVRSRCILQACAPLTAEDMQQVLSAQGMDVSWIELAIALAQGSPGSVEVLLDNEHAKALADWQRILTNLLKADVAAIQQWLEVHAAKLPHDLIASMVMLAIHQQFLQATASAQLDWTRADAIYHASMQIAAWPKEVLRHSLRPAPALLSRILQLRMALKA